MLHTRATVCDGPGDGGAEGTLRRAPARPNTPNHSQLQRCESNLKRVEAMVVYFMSQIKDGNGWAPQPASHCRI
jgi:hypothetical protein